MTGVQTCAIPICFDELEREIFGPVLHVVRYKRKDIDQLIAQINASGYGLRMKPKGERPNETRIAEKVHELLIQWTAVDGQAFVPNSGMPQVPVLPDWSRIAKEPWAQDVIVGLAGFYSENRSRDNIEELATLSSCLPEQLSLWCLSAILLLTAHRQRCKNSIP